MTTLEHEISWICRVPRISVFKSIFFLQIRLLYHIFWHSYWVTTKPIHSTWEYIQPKYRHLVFSNFICTHGHRTNPLPEQENEQKSVSIFYCSAVLLDPCKEKESLSPFYIAYLILFNHHSSIKLALKPPFFESLFLGLAYIDQHMIKFPTRK